MITAVHPTQMSYSQASLVVTPSQFLFISGQVPADGDNRVPADFDAQCRLVWSNIETQLAAAGMGLSNLVKVTTFLSDRQYRSINARIRHEILSGHAPALTVIIAGIYEPEWLLEIEAIAAR